MKANEIIGALRDLVDKICKDDQTQAVNVYPTQQRFAPVAPITSIQDIERTHKDEEPPLDTMVPPLQQKIELLKRATDIDNIFDGTSIDKTTNGQDDASAEIAIIKKNAGINPVALDALGDDEPLDV